LRLRFAEIVSQIIASDNAIGGLNASRPILFSVIRFSKLPPRARAILVEYVEEKSFGLYGGARDNNSDLPFACPTPSQARRARMKRNDEGAKKCLGGARPFLGQCVRARRRMRTPEMRRLSSTTSDDDPA
jgi:hypothetical protein